MPASEARDLTLQERDFIQAVFTEGWGAATQRFTFNRDRAEEIFNIAGFEAGQISLLEQLPGIGAAAFIDANQVPESLQPAFTQAQQVSQLGADQFRDPSTPLINDQRNQLQRFQGGLTDPQMELTATGLDLVQSRGVTNESTFLKGAGQDLVSSGGLARAPGLEEAQKNALAALGREDPGLAKIRDAGLALVEAGGFTPELRGLLGQATNLLAVVGTGGMTPQLQQVFDQAIGLVKSGGRGGALLPFDQVLQNAREEAAFAINSQVNRAVREASARGGFQGGLVAGAAASPLAEFADQAGEIQARAVRQASESQQALQLQQQGQAFGAAGQAAAAGAARESSLASIGAGLAGNVANAASSNLQSGLSNANAAQQAEVQRQGVTRGQLIDIGSILTDREKLGAGMIESAQRSEMDRFGLGTNVLTTQTQQQLQASELLNQLQSIENQRQQIGLQGLTAGTGNQLAILGFGTGVQQQNFNNSLAFGSFTEALRQQDINNMFASLGLIQDQGNAFLNFGSSALGPMSNLTLGAAQFQSQPGFWSQLGGDLLRSAVGAGATAITGGIPLPFGGTSSGAFDPSFGQGG